MTTHFFSNLRRRTVTYWSPLVNIGLGTTTFNPPVSVKCRWQDKQQIVMDADGDEFVSQHVAYPIDDVLIGGYMSPEISSAADPRSVASARQIRQVYTTVSLKNVTRLVKAWL